MRYEHLTVFILPQPGCSRAIEDRSTDRSIDRVLLRAPNSDLHECKSIERTIGTCTETGCSNQPNFVLFYFKNRYASVAIIFLTSQKWCKI